VSTTPELARRNRRLMWALLGGFAGLTVLALGSAPLYQLYCEVTGYAGTPVAVAAAATPASVLDRRITVAFNADTAPDLPWRFAASQPKVTVRLGEKTTAHFTVTNNGSRPLVGKAVSSVPSDTVSAYVDQVQCFCSTEQVLQPGQTADLAVTFYIDPKLADDPGLRGLKEIALSYMFFAATSDHARSLLAQAQTAGAKR
jgi:cytochrome c oxidase assembly protein subunit 11